MFKRKQFTTLLNRLKERRKFIQILAGPRQVGKTTLVRQVLEPLEQPNLYVSADEPTLRRGSWIEQQWERARHGSQDNGMVFVLDEVQKIPKWSETVKRLWDEDTHHGLRLKLVLLGSSPLLIQKGLSESLAGRFETIFMPHWNFGEMAEAFGWSIDHYIFHGGYPGAAELSAEPGRWARYIVDSLLETTISRDILLMTRVDKPALLRQVFHLGCEYSGQVFSYQKMLGQLQDAGNTTTVAHYLQLLESAGMLAGIPKFAARRIRQRGSSPKLNILNTALMTASCGLSYEQARAQTDIWGRIVESAIGAHLLNGVMGTAIGVFYWKEGDKEVDFVLKR